MYVSNERKGGLYIDLLITAPNSHEAWKGRVCSWQKGEFKLAPNPNPARPGSVRFGEAAARARVW